MDKFNEKISKLYDDMFGESLDDELEKVKKKIAGQAEDDDGDTVNLDNIEPLEEHEDEDDAETEEPEEPVIDDGEDAPEPGDEHSREDSKSTFQEGVDCAQIYNDISLQFEDMSDDDLEYEKHLSRQQLFDLEDQYGPNSKEYMEAFIKMRIAYQKLNSSSITPDADVFSPVWTV